MTVDVNGVTSSRGCNPSPSTAVKTFSEEWRSGETGLCVRGQLVELEVDLCFQCVAKY